MLAGQLPGAEEQPLAVHVETCNRCQQILENLTDLAAEPRFGPEGEVSGGGKIEDRDARIEGATPLPDLQSPSPASRSRAVRSGGSSGSRFRQAALHRLRRLLPADGSVDPPSGTVAASDWPRVPGYEILRVLGRGGMAVVYLARHQQLNRLVALKMILAGKHASPEELVRFCIEGETVARLRHPHIVQIYEVGSYNQQPYFALEYLEGGNLAEALGGKPLPAQAAAGLVETLARTMEYAHQQGIVHRDLKPANVLLSRSEERESRGAAETVQADLRSSIRDPRWWVPKITDFGLAKQLHNDLRLTQTGLLLGTPSYMAPEQVRGQSHRVGPATDVYALGAILYELLTGRPPFQAASSLEVLNQVLDFEPVPPSRLLPPVPPDLETICLKCLEKEPTRRYPSAQALADDLRRFLAHEPIQARPAGTMERMWKWARRRPALAGLIAAVVLAVLAGTGVSTFFGFQAQQRAGEAKKASAEARHAAAVARQLADEKEQAYNAAQQARQQSDLRAAELKFAAALDQCNAGAVGEGLFSMLEAWRLAPADAQEFRRVVRTNLAAWSRQLPRLQWASRPPEGVGGVLRLLEPDGKTFVTCDRAGRFRYGDIATGELAGAPLPLPLGHVPRDISPDGSLVTTCAGVDWFVVKTATGEFLGGPQRHRNPDNRVTECSASFRGPARSVVVTVGNAENVFFGYRRFWDVATGAEYPRELKFNPGESYHVTADRDGKNVLVVFRRGTPPRAEFIDLQTGKALPSLHSPRGGQDPRINWDGRLILSINGDDSVIGGQERQCDGSVSWWDTATGNLAGEVWRPGRGALYSALSRNSQVLASWCRDQRIRLYDLDVGQQRGGDIPTQVFEGTESWRRLAVTPDGAQVLTVTADGTLRLWQTRHVQLQQTIAATPRTLRPDARPLFRDVVFSPDGTKGLALSDLGSLNPPGQGFGRLVDVAANQPRGRPLRHSYVGLAAFSADGSLIATATDASWGGHLPEGAPVIRVWDAVTGQPRTPLLRSPKLIHGLAFSPDGRTLAAACVGGTFLWDVKTARILSVLHEDTVATRLVFSPDGRHLAVGYKSGWSNLGAGFRLWNVTSGKPVGQFVKVSLPPREYVGGLAFAEEGRTLLAFDPRGGVLHTLDTRTGQPRKDPLPLDRAELAAFSADGAALATCDTAGSVQQWDPATGLRRGPAMVQPHPVAALRYSPDRKTLAVLCHDNTVRLWDTATGLPIGPPLLHRRGVLSLTFTPQSSAVVTATDTGAMYTWPLSRPVADDPDRMEVWVQAVGGVTPKGTATVLLDVKTWEEKRQELRRRWSEADPALGELPDEAAWHETRARAAEEDGNITALLWHLDRLTALEPGNWLPHARRGRAYSEAGDLEQAARAYDQAAHGGEALADWYRHRAVWFTQRREWPRALWYLDRLIAACPGEPQAYVDRALAYHHLSKEAERDADLARAVEKGALDLQVCYHHALACLKAGNQAAYQRVCVRLLQTLPADVSQVDPGLANNLAMMCALGPDAVSDWKQPLALIEHALRVLDRIQVRAEDEELLARHKQTRHAWLNTHGAVLYRAGRFPEAVARLHQAVEIHGRGGAFHDWVFLAMAHHCLGQAREAQEWLDRARRDRPPTATGLSWDALEKWLLCAEAEALIQGTSAHATDCGAR